MATIRLTHAEIEVPGSPTIRLHLAEVATPDVPRIRLHYAELETGAGGTATVRLHHGSLTIPAAQDALPASGLLQLLGDENWHNQAVYQLSGGVWQ
jgi:hypothetical protein